METSHQINIKTDERMIAHRFCLDENGNVIVSGEKVEDIIKEKEYWHRQAITYAAQLGEIRILMDNFNKAKLPDTTCTAHNKT